MRRNGWGLSLFNSRPVVTLVSNSMVAGLFVTVCSWRHGAVGSVTISRHGPFLVMGGLVGLLWGTEIWDWYVR